MSTPLSQFQKSVASRFETCLAGQWVNDAGKWIIRIRGTAAVCERLIAEVENAAKEGRIQTTPAQYSEFLWKQFCRNQPQPKN